MLKIMNSTINVVTIDSQSPNYSETCERIHNFIDDNFDFDFRLKENYSPEKLNLKSQLAISTYEIDNEILGFSTVLYRDIFYNGARILNRFIKSKKYRFVNKTKMKSFVTPETQLMLKQQIEVVKNAGFDFAFMSREGSIPKSNMVHFTKSMPWCNWFIPDERYRLCPSGEACWQHITVAPISDPFVIKMDSMTEDEYYETFKR